MRLAIVTDEVASDVAEAVSLGLGWGIRDFELRKCWGRRVPDLDAAQVSELLSLQETHGLRYTALSPGLFKQPLGHPDSQRDLADRLPRSIALARRLGADRIITFGFPRSVDDPADAWDRIRAWLRRAAAIAGDAGMLLCLEPERGCWCGTGTQSAAAVRAVGHPALRINWDPGNCAAAGQRPFPEGYAAVAGLVAHVHIKDYAPGPAGQFGRWALPGDGMIDWAGQVAALAADLPVEYLTIETHCQPAVEGSRLAVERVRQYLRAAGMPTS